MTNNILTCLYNEAVDNRVNKLQAKDLNGNENIFKRDLLRHILQCAKINFDYMFEQVVHHSLPSARNNYEKMMLITMDITCDFVQTSPLIELFGIHPVAAPMCDIQIASSENNKVKVTPTNIELRSRLAGVDFTFDISEKTDLSTDNVAQEKQNKIFDTLRNTLDAQTFKSVSRDLQKSFDEANKVKLAETDVLNITKSALQQSLNKDFTDFISQIASKNITMDNFVETIETMGLGVVPGHANYYLILGHEDLIDKLKLYGKFTNKKTQYCTDRKVFFTGVLNVGDKRINVYINEHMSPQDAFLGLKQSNTSAPVHWAMMQLILSTPIVIDPQTFLPKVAFMFRYSKTIIKEDVDKFLVKVKL